MNIILHCEAQKLRNGKLNPKNYPYWKDLIENLKEFNFIQIGVESDTQYVDDFRKNLEFNEIKKLLIDCKSWIAVDSFFQHLAWEMKKPGICIFGLSDPLIFGHKENINIVDRSKLRKNQFSTWEEIEYDETAFEKPFIIADEFRSLINRL